MQLPFLFRLPRSIGYGAKVTTNNLYAMLIFLTIGINSIGQTKAEQITIAALGDSLVHGYGLQQELGFVPQLEQWLLAQGLDVKLINAGVSGDTTAGGLARVDWTLSPEVDALIISLGGNDVLRGIDPAVSRANLDGILGKATASKVPVLLVGISAPGNYGIDYQEQFNAIYPDLAKQYGVLLYPNFLRALADLPDRAAVLAQYFQPDAIHPNADGVVLIVEDIGPSVAALVVSATAD
ncbi:MAG: arylesterase [Marinosulfonomonas sp.]|nr:MAG: arylesterase [Marinosulfonomonas sp.]